MDTTIDVGALAPIIKPLLTMMPVWLQAGILGLLLFSAQLAVVLKFLKWLLFGVFGLPMVTDQDKGWRLGLFRALSFADHLASNSPMFADLAVKLGAKRTSIRPPPMPILMLALAFTIAACGGMTPMQKQATALSITASAQKTAYDIIQGEYESDLKDAKAKAAAAGVDSAPAVSKVQQDFAALNKAYTAFSGALYVWDAALKAAAAGGSEVAAGLKEAAEAAWPVVLLEAEKIHIDLPSAPPAPSSLGGGS